MADDKDIGREILAIAERMHAKMASGDSLDDDVIGELREQGKEMDRLADQLK